MQTPNYTESKSNTSPQESLQDKRPLIMNTETIYDRQKNNLLTSS